MLEEVFEIYVDASVVNQKACIVGKYKEIQHNGEELFKELFYKELYNAKSAESEILACAFALEEADRLGLVEGKKRVVIYSDFQAVVERYQTMAHWIGKGISSKSHEFVVDIQEWKKLARQRENYFQKYRIRVELNKTKAHHNDAYNNSVDAMAKNIARQPGYLYPKQTLVLAPEKKQKIQKQKNQSSGIVKLIGQQLPIRIHKCEYWKKKIWIYKYEFFSIQKSSWVYSEHKIFSRHSLEYGKTYLATVSMNKNTPWILDAKETET